MKPVKMVRKNKNDVDVFVEKLFKEPKDVSLQECFMAAAEAEEYLRIVRTKLAVKVTYDLPEVVDKVIEKAKSGNLEAARLLFDITGATKRLGTTVNVATQINLSPQEQQLLEKDFGDAVDVDAAGGADVE